MPRLCITARLLAGCVRSCRPSFSRSRLPIWLALAATLVAPTSRAVVGEVVSETKISDTQGGFTGTLSNTDRFGECVAYLGDVDGDGVGDLVTSTLRPTEEGLAWILFLNPDDTVKSHTAIGGGGIGGYLPDTEPGDRLGQCGEGLGDLNYDGVPDLAVMSEQGGENAVWILFLEADGTVRSEQRIASGDGGFPTGEVVPGDHFGRDIARLGDVDGDGVVDIAVGAPNHDDGGTDRGGVFVLFLEPDGYVKDWTRISHSTEPGLGLANGDKLGLGVTGLGDVDGDGVPDLAAGALFADATGAVYVLLLNADGSVKSHQKLGSAAVGGGLDSQDRFGIGVARLGDLDGDGVPELAVGASRDDDGGTDFGAMWVILLNSDGTAKGYQKISALAGGFTGPLNTGDELGMAVEGYRGADGQPRLAAGARQDDDGGTNRGALYILELDGDAQPVVCGDFRREDTEECDDGNTLSADGCSATCEQEEAFLLRGTASGGGTVSVTVSGHAVAADPAPGQSAESVLDALATEIASTPALQLLGVTAQSKGQALFTTGEISASSNTAGGLIAGERDDLLVTSSSLSASFVAKTTATTWGKVAGISLSSEMSPGIPLRGGIGTFDVLGGLPISGSGTVAAGVTTDAAPRSLEYSVAGVVLFGCDRSAPATTDLHASLFFGSQWLVASLGRDAGTGIQCSGWPAGLAGLQTPLSDPHYPRPIAYGYPYLLSTHTPYAYYSNGAGLGWLTGTATVAIVDAYVPVVSYLKHRGVSARTPGGRGALNLVSPAAALNVTPIPSLPTTYAVWATYATQANLRLRIIPEPTVPLGLAAGALGAVVLARWRRRRA